MSTHCPQDDVTVNNDFIPVVTLKSFNSVTFKLVETSVRKFTARLNIVIFTHYDVIICHKPCTVVRQLI